MTEKTRGILICNPNNPSGSLYSREEMEMLGDIVRRHGIFLFADEVYREFVYDGMEFFSAGHLKGVDEHVVIFDSMSKRFSECGIRIGAVISKNRPVAEGFLKLAQARLSPPLIGQIVAEASFSAGHAYLDPVAETNLSTTSDISGSSSFPFFLGSILCPLLYSSASRSASRTERSPSIILSLRSC